MRFLKTVTITGADDSIDYHALYDLSLEYPFVEWGILLSKNSEGYSRFPTWKWIEGLITEKPSAVKLSGHLCGSWVRNIIAGGTEFLDAHRELSHDFNRFQLNFHGQPHFIPDIHKLVEALRFLTGVYKQQVICQVDGTDGERIFRKLASQYAKEQGIHAAPLFDLSGGSGSLPKEWPKPIDDYCGYAGGLSPENVAHEVERIAERIKCEDGTYPPIWIDVESKVRSLDNRLFALRKVRAFLKNTAEYVRD